MFASYAVHLPEPTCGAHSVIATCKAGDEQKTYQKPSRTAINDLRVKLAAKFLPQPPHEAIARAAYFQWLDEGKPSDGPDTRWLQAEMRLLQEHRNLCTASAM
jgi:hypothetical protein